MNELDEKAVVLIVDDAIDNITLISGLLSDQYKVKIALNGEKAISIAKKSPPDIILLDVVMPVMDGYEACRIIKSYEQLKDIPVIFLTAESEIEDESRSFALGAADFITKPVNPVTLLSRVKTHLSLKKASDFLKSKNQYLEFEVSRRTKETSLIQEVSIMAMVTLAETRDSETGAHIQRTKLYVRQLCEQLAKNPKNHRTLTRGNIDLIVVSAPLHDIGKVGIPDSILLKPAKLTPDEFAIMKTHTTLGRDSIAKAEQLMGGGVTFLRYPKEIVYSHHEKWDGTGYPLGLAGADIPFPARIVALADVYDALTSQRVYKLPVSHEEAVKIIKDEAGKHFDPEIVEAFEAVHESFHEICERYGDE